MKKLIVVLILMLLMVGNVRSGTVKPYSFPKDFKKEIARLEARIVELENLLYPATEIVIILDRSGSMENMEKDMEGGLNKFVADQQKLGGKAYFTLVQFDDEYEVIHKFIDIQDVGKIDIVPRNRTALLDAIGKTLDNHLILSDRKVVYVIITDGLENASTEYDKSTIITMIESRKKCGWEFIYLGANQDAIQEGTSIGFNPWQCITYDSSNVSGTIDAMSVTVSGYRTGGE
ncbi:hypothetical protein LCGC14_0756690 [marine sediment metagenome]|uniref:VWFA domain-containing protein n=1 Tax=marine sediment metagenome TaxID=412755 RepID=A0A0F9T9D5_9ZZZZ|nr:VWA domain-containing protein [Pricia sp.]